MEDEKEWNLSEKAKNNSNVDNIAMYFYNEKDVKEFIRRLDALFRTIKLHDTAESYSFRILHGFKELAGEKLI